MVAEDSLNLMRTALETLTRMSVGEGQAKRPLEVLSREINTLSRLVDEIRQNTK